MKNLLILPFIAILASCAVTSEESASVHFQQAEQACFAGDVQAYQYQNRESGEKIQLVCK